MLRTVVFCGTIIITLSPGTSISLPTAENLSVSKSNRAQNADSFSQLKSKLKTFIENSLLLILFVFVLAF